MRGLRTYLWALVVVGVAAALPAMKLAGTVDWFAEIPFSVPTATTGTVPLELPEEFVFGTRGSYWLHRSSLVLSDPVEMLRHSEIRFLVGNYEIDRTIAQGQLRIRGTTCVYRTGSGVPLPNNALVAFVADRECSTPSGTPTGRAELLVQFAAPGRMALWTSAPAGSDATGAVRVVDARLVRPVDSVYVRGTLGDRTAGPRVRRLDLLEFQWSPAAPSRLALSLLFSAVLFAWLSVAIARRAWGTDPARTETIAAAAFCAAASLGVAYCVVVPPFQAPDEPDHFLAYAAIAGSERLTQDAEAWARTIHFARLRQGPLEHFTPTHRNAPLPDGWPADVFKEDTRARSGLAAGWWQLIAGLTRDLPVERTLLVLRLCNAMLFAAAVGIGAALVHAAGHGGAAFAWLVVPTLPFFAMHVSETALLTSIYIVLGSLTVVLSADARRADWLGLPLGLTFSLALSGGRSALPMTGIMAFLLLTRCLLGTPRDEAAARVRAAATFWIGFTLGFATYGAFLPDRFFAEMSRIGHWYMPTWFGSVLASLQQPVLFAAIVGVVGVAIELAAGSVRGFFRSSARTIFRVVAAAIAMGVLGSLVASLAISLPTLPSVEGFGRSESGRYVGNAIAAVVTMWRLSDHDVFTSTTFWGGFGWLETLLPDPLVSLAAALSACALARHALALARGGQTRRLLPLAAVMLGVVASVALYAVSSFLLYRTLHGRYLIGAYVVLLTVAWCGATRPRQGGELLGGMLMCGAVAAVHAVAVTFLLGRYF